MSSETAISLRHVAKAYHVYARPADRLKQLLWPRGRYHREFWALRDVSFDVRRGESAGLIGRNGAGKSTLLQLVAGTLSPSAGRVQLRGRVSPLLELGSGFDPRFSGRENVFLNAALFGLERREVEQRFDEIAAFAAIGAFMEQPLATYSSGMAMRLAFAVACAVEPDVLLIDEVLSVGDLGFQHKCLARLEDLRARGVTLLVASHDTLLLRNLCDRVVYLREGRVREIGPPEAVGEAYIRDTLAESQRDGALALRDRGASAGVAADALRFGSGAGEVVEIEVRRGDAPCDLFDPGDPIRVRVVARVAESVRSPDVVIQLRDFRGYVIYGQRSQACGIFAKPDASGLFAVEFEFPCRLFPGHYALTVSLNERLGDTEKLVVDKVVGAAHFGVAEDPAAPFHGVVDLGARCRVVSAEEIPG